MLVDAKYLGSSDSIISVQSFTNGGAADGQVIIYHNDYLNGVDGKRKYRMRSSLKIPGAFLSSVEICGIPRLQKTYAAVVGTTLSSSQRSCLYFLDINIDHQSPTLSLVDTDIYDNGLLLTDGNAVSNSSFLSTGAKSSSNKLNHFPDSSSHLTTSTFDFDLEVMAIGDEHGDISLFDVVTGKEIYSVHSDALGIRKLRFLPSKQLASLGSSAEKTAKIYDFRTPSVRSTINTPAPMSTDLKNSPNLEPYHHFHSHIQKNNATSKAFDEFNRNEKLNKLMCFINHPTQEKLFFGSNEGNVFLWDYRKPNSYVVEYSPHFAAGNHRISFLINSSYFFQFS